VKVKFNRRQEFVVGGFKPNAGGFESLLVGYYEGRKLMFAGKVRAGLTPHTRVDLFPMLKAIVQPKCPFANLPSSKTGPWGEGITAEDMAVLRWVKLRDSLRGHGVLGSRIFQVAQEQRHACAIFGGECAVAVPLLPRMCGGRRRAASRVQGAWISRCEWSSEARERRGERR
jgi:hypothetical protein